MSLRKRSLAASLVGAVLIALSASPAQAAVWNLATDFKTSPNQANPNPDSIGNAGTWSFVQGASMAHDPATYSLLPNFGPKYFSTSQEGWTGSDPNPVSQDGATVPFVGINKSTIVSGSTWVKWWGPQQIMVQPSPNRLVAVAWRSPITGSVWVDGWLSGVADHPGDGIRWSVDRGATTLMSGALAHTQEKQLTLSPVAVRAGDVLYFTFDPGAGGDAKWDYLLFDLTITSGASCTITGSGTITGTAGPDVICGAAGNDVIDGAGGHDIVRGGAGNDTLRGGDGRDRMYAGAGNDSLYGGNGADLYLGEAGTDTADYSTRPSGVTVSIDDRNDDVSLEADDVRSDMENVTGTASVDSIVGSSAVNVLRGGGGNDTLWGRSGNDTLDGGAGDDKVGATEIENDGEAGNDTLDGGTGKDKLIGGTGTDTVTYATRTASVDATISTVAGDTAPHDDGQAGEQDQIRSDVENLIGGRGADRLVGVGTANVLDGGWGADILIGGAGSDTVTYATRTAAQPLAAAPNGAATSGDTSAAALDGPAGARDQIMGDVEKLIGGAGSDGLTGSGAANTLTGGLGDDSLSGEGGNDTLDGGNGADTYSGGAGTDTVTYAARKATQPVVVAIDGTPNSGDTSASNLDGPAGARDTLLTDVENVLGGAGSDMLTGSPFANVLTGNKGVDRLIGLDGNDSLKARDSVVDMLIDCDGGPTPGGADVADVDLNDPAPVGCETVTHP